MILPDVVKIRSVTLVVELSKIKYNNLVHEHIRNPLKRGKYQIRLQTYITPVYAMFIEYQSLSFVTEYVVILKRLIGNNINPIK